MSKQGKLTDATIRGPKAAPGAKKRKLGDGAGLFLQIEPIARGGGKYWRYRFTIDGVEKEMSLGVFPTVSLADARKARDVERGKVAVGVDPAAVRQTVRVKAANDAGRPYTFGVMLADWIAHQKRAYKPGVAHSGWSPSTCEQRELWAARDVLPRLGSIPAADLQNDIGIELIRALFKDLLGVGVRPRTDTVKRVRNLISQAFEWGKDQGKGITRNPVNELKGKNVIPSAPVVSHPAIVVPQRIGDLLRVIEAGHGVRPLTQAALKLSAYLVLRSSELRRLQWEWVTLDGAEPEIRIPGPIMKMDDEFVVPLCKQTVAMFRDLRKISGDGVDCFPCAKKTARVMSENTLNNALAAMGYDGEATQHGFRTTFSTRLNELGFDPHLIELQLDHRERDAVRGAYNRPILPGAQRLEARRRLMAEWARILDSYRAGKYAVSVRPVSVRDAA